VAVQTVRSLQTRSDVVVLATRSHCEAVHTVRSLHVRSEDVVAAVTSHCDVVHTVSGSQRPPENSEGNSDCHSCLVQCTGHGRVMHG
jgi:hypothetical protein